MRKRKWGAALLCAALLAALLPAAAQAEDVTIDETNFPDAAFREYVGRVCDSDGNKVLSAEEIGKVEGMLLIYGLTTGSKIESLKGIEYFTALTELRCSNNELTELDVTQNTALTDLNCSENELTELDVTKNTALTELRCSDNALTELDVSKNTALTSLNCSYNALTELDVSQNTALTYLGCYSNELTALDVSKNTALTDLSCYSNELTALDVSQNTALTRLDCSDTALTELDVSKNTELEHLWCNDNALTELDVSKNTELEHLWCNDNALTALDVSKNTALTRLDCYNNALTALDVSKNTALERLYCYNNALTALDVSKNTALTRLDCNNNALTALDLSQNTKLTTLDCSGQQAAETRVLQQADGSGRADLSGLVPGWSGSQGVQVQGGTLEADGSTVVWDGKSSPVTVTYAYRTGYRDVTLDATLNLFFDSGSRPVFTQPAGAQTVTVAAGQTGTLRAAATDALVYQWYVNRNDGAGYVAVSGATGATYTTGAATVENDGYTYYCEATNAFGTTSSPVFTLRVTAEPEPVPETGDGSDPALWLTLALLSLCGLGALTFGRRRGAARR